jgi:moderate conductance mechanosensitive channel
VLLAATITDACGAAPGSACSWVWHRTHNETLAKITDWLVARPLRITLILLGAYVIDRLVRRGIRKLVDRITRETDEALRGGDGGDRLWLERLRERNERARQRTVTLGAVLRSGASVIIYGLAALMCLGELDISLGPLIAGAGIAGIAIGFGAQSLVRDFLAGIFIVLEDQYGVGDTVNLGAEASGTVEKVTLRTTSLRDLDGTLWVVPNGEIRRVANRTQRWARAVLDMRVDYDADLNRALDVARDAATSFYEANADSDDMIEAPEVLGVESFLDGAAVLRITVKTEPGRQFAVARSMRVALKQAFDSAGIRVVAGATAPPPGPPR